MLPVLTSPRGSKNVSFSTFSTLYDRSVSEREFVDRGFGCPWTMPFPDVALAPLCAGAAFLFRSNSAQDFGGAFLGASGEGSGTVSDAEPVSGAATPFTVPVSELVIDSVVSADDLALFEATGAGGALVFACRGITGMAGIMGLGVACSCGAVCTVAPEAIVEVTGD